MNKKMPPRENTPEKIESVKVEDKYPSVSVAYELAVKAYEFGERRLQVVETRNEKVLGFTSSLNLVLIAFLSSSSPQNLRFSSWLFIIAFLSGIVSLLVGIVVMLSGEVAPIDIAKIYETWLHLDENDFKTDFIIKSSEDFKTNIESVDRKSQLTNLSAIFFILETIFLLSWLLIR